MRLVNFCWNLNGLFLGYKLSSSVLSLLIDE